MKNCQNSLRLLATAHTTRLAAIVVIALPAFATDITWTGGGTDNNWSTAANWDSGIPATGDSVTINLATGGTSHNDVLTTGNYVTNLVFGTDAGAWTLTSAYTSLRLTSVTSASSANQLVDFSVMFSNKRDVTVNGAGILTFNKAAINQTTGNTGGIRKRGTGTLVLAAKNSYTKDTEVQEGTLRLGVADAIASSSAVTLGGGTLDTGGFDQTLNALTITANSFLDFSGGGTLTIASASITNDSTLTLQNFDTTTCSLSFTGGILAGNVSDILLDGHTASIDTNGVVTFTAIPEPATTVLIGGLVILGGILTQRSRPRPPAP
jgi:autotransporter-associated beta strand protein